MIEFDLSRARRARVWLDEPPGVEAQVLSRRLAPVAPVVRVAAFHGIVGVELFVPVGARFLYGLVGASVIGPSVGSSDVAIDVPIASAVGPVYVRSLAGNLDTVRWGLTDEYGAAVVRGAMEAMLRYGAPDAKAVRFSWAAHSQVGSSSSMFARLASIAVRVILAPPGADVRAIIEAE